MADHDARRAILAAIRRATPGTGTPLPPPAPRPVDDRPLIDTFAAEVRAVTGTAHCGVRADALADAVAAALPADRGAPFVCWDTPLLRRLTGEAPLRDAAHWLFAPAGLADPEADAEWHAAAAQAPVGITEADFALADTGTLVLRAAPGQARLASLLPPAHIAVVAAHCVLPHLDALLQRLASDRDRLTACLTFITGPSRTSDIEKKLVLGAHGPKRLHIIVYE